MRTDNGETISCNLHVGLVIIIQDVQRIRQNNGTTQNDAKCDTNELKRAVRRYSHCWDTIGKM